MNYLYNLPKSFKPKYNFDLIRLGRNNDGGYLVGKNTVKNTVKNTENLISIEITLEKKPRIVKYSYLNENNLNHRNNVYKKDLKIRYK